MFKSRPRCAVAPSRPRRLLNIVGLGVLFITVLGLFSAYHYTRTSPVPKTRISPGQQLTPADPLREILPGGETAEEDGGDRGGDDLYTLHPEEHISRHAKTINLNWDVTLGELAPDGVKRPVYIINGQFPGPIIEARSGDELAITVRNLVEGDDAEGIAIHWHGLSMRGANEMDGVVGLTQCAIGPSESFTYRFRIEPTQSGTFWYHAHSHLQRADGLFGGIVVHKPTTQSDGFTPSPSDLSVHGYQMEKLLLVGDWYHRQANTVLEWYENPDHYGNEPAPDSILINGKGSYKCSMAVKVRPVDCTPVERPAVTLPATTERVRLRVVNTGAFTGFTLSVSQASMRVITVDGGNRVAPDTPAAASVGLLHPGERVDVVIERRLSAEPEEDHEEISAYEVSPSGAELSIALSLENLRLTNHALTPKQSFPLMWTGDGGGDESYTPEREAGQEDILPHLDLAEGLLGTPETFPAGLADPPQETAVVYSKVQIRSSHHNSPVGIVNHTSWVVADPKALPLLALDRGSWDGVTEQPSPAQTLHVPWFPESGEEIWMELVVNNLDDRSHPFHLHGYEFYVVSTHRAARGQYEAYNPFDESVAAPGGLSNLVNPLRKDTVNVPRMGYVVLRFPLANDGIWLLHCHALWHQAVGMGMAFHIGKAVTSDLQQRVSALCTKTRGVIN